MNNEGVHRVGGGLRGGRDAAHELLHGRPLRPQGEMPGMLWPRDVNWAEQSNFRVCTEQ